MNIEEKSRRDLIERYKRLERKDKNQKGCAQPQSKYAVSKEIKNFLQTSGSQQVVQKLPENATKVSVEWKKPAPKAVEEDEYYAKIEEIIRRDFYPDLVKLDALRQYDQDAALKSGVRPPSILLRSTGKSRLSDVTNAKKPDPVDDFIAMKRKELGLKPVVSENSGKRKKMGLNEFLRRFTSEDNASF